ncbi:MAG: rRNA maturation RNase YbeY [Chloroflexi bacterium]|nr:rRNA maturation RNase YbeY [Chloroflexota bacterium]
MGGAVPETESDRARTHYLDGYRVDVTTRAGVQGLLPVTRLVRTLVAGLSAASAPTPARIGLTLTNDAEITVLNEEHMGHEGPTDVLSFPLLVPSAFPVHPGQDPPMRLDSGPAFVLPPGVRTDLGDIVVSVERAIEQAEEGRGGHTGDVRWSPSDELRLLVTHGALHVCGWDHARPDEEAAMRALERQLLSGAVSR